jgi:hypothetical protein
LALAGGLALAATTIAASASAANARVESAAKRALEQAQNDYLAMNYGTGAAKLNKALRACGKRSCTTQTRAALLRDLGTMQFRRGDRAGAVKSWKAAAKLQPDLELNPAYDAPDVRAAFEDATGIRSQPSGDFTHTPAIEQKANTPLPVYVEGGGNNVVRVILKYQGAGMTGWKRITLKRLGDGWGGVIPCADVTDGTMRYYIEGLDAANEPVANSGDSKHPFTVPIRDEIRGEAPHLPGKPPPRTCGGGGDNDCPPDFPGCSTGGESTGDNGEEHGESKENEGEGEGQQKGASRRARFWVGASLGVDFMQIPSGNDLCRLDPNTALPANSANLYCTNTDGSDFPTRQDGGALNNALIQGQAGNTAGGIQRANVRLMFSFDYALNGGWMVGARLGAIFYPYPGQAAIGDGRAPGGALGRLYVDARATWVIGDEPLYKAGFAPMVFAGGGVQQFAASIATTATINNPNAPGGTQTGNVNVWRVDGPWFLMLGGGVRWAVTERFALTGALRLNGAFGDNGFIPTFGPEVGGQVGF